MEPMGSAGQVETSGGRDHPPTNAYSATDEESPQVRLPNTVPGKEEVTVPLW